VKAQPTDELEDVAAENPEGEEAEVEEKAKPIFRSALSASVADQIWNEFTASGGRTQFGPDDKEVIVEVTPDEKSLVIRARASRPAYADQPKEFIKKVAGRVESTAKRAIEEVYLRALSEAQRLMLIAELFDLFERKLVIGDNEEALARIEAIASRTKRTLFYEQMTEDDVVFWLDEARIVYEELGPWVPKPKVPPLDPPKPEVDKEDEDEE